MNRQLCIIDTPTPLLSLYIRELKHGPGVQGSEQIQGTQDFAKDSIRNRPRTREDHSFPKEIWKKACKLGFHELLPEKYGGQDTASWRTRW
jgi:hypothetical protein